MHDMTTTRRRSLRHGPASVAIMTLFGVLLISLAGCSGADDSGGGSDALGPTATIPGHDSFANLLTDTGLGGVVAEPTDKATIFAPSDGALNEARSANPDLFAGVDQEAFVGKLQIVPERLDAAQLASLDGSRIRTAAGLSFPVEVQDGTPTIGGLSIGALVHEDENITVFALDGVLLPTP